MPDEALLPPIDPEAAPFWEGASRGELMIQKCPETDRLIFPPRSTSPWAPQRDPVWVAVSGRGTIWSFAVPHPPLLPPFTELAPYNVVVVALEEDATIRLVGNLVEDPDAGINSTDPATIAIGARVRVVFQAASEEIQLPRWVLDPERAD